MVAGGGFDTGGHGVGDQAIGIDLVGDGAIGGAAGAQQGVHAAAPFLFALGMEQRAVGGGGQAAQDFILAGRQADEHAAARQGRARAFIEQGAAAGADHQVLFGGQLDAERRLRRPEGLLAFLGKDGGDGLAKAFDQQRVHIDKAPPQPCGQQPAHRGFARAHKAGDDNVLP